MDRENRCDCCERYFRETMGTIRCSDCGKFTGNCCEQCARDCRILQYCHRCDMRDPFGDYPECTHMRDDQ